MEPTPTNEAETEIPLQGIVLSMDQLDAHARDEFRGDEAGYHSVGGALDLVNSAIRQAQKQEPLQRATNDGTTTEYYELTDNGPRTREETLYISYGPQGIVVTHERADGAKYGTYSELKLTPKGTDGRAFSATFKSSQATGSASMPTVPIASYSDENLSI